MKRIRGGGCDELTEEGLRVREESSIPGENAAQNTATEDHQNVMMLRRLVKLAYAVLLKLPFDIVLFVLNLPIQILVMLLSMILSRTLHTPSVRTAVAQCLLAGVHAVCEDPELDRYMDQATTTLNADMMEDAENMGREVPRVLGNFIKGMFKGHKEATKKEHNGDESLLAPHPQAAGSKQ